MDVSQTFWIQEDMLRYTERQAAVTARMSFVH